MEFGVFVSDGLLGNCRSPRVLPISLLAQEWYQTANQPTLVRATHRP